MESKFWHSRWQENKIGFHQSKYNSRLTSLWPSLSLPQGAEVFVPLCGKTLDMLWLHEQGFKVLGVELSEIAAAAYFDENDLPYNVTQSGGLQLFTGAGRAAGIRILAGDMFAMKSAQTAGVSAVYDRASMVAMPPELRQQYVDHLAALLPVNATGILISMNYDPSKMKGPPFSVPDDVVRELLQPYYSLSVLAHSEGPERLGNLKGRGLDTLEEHVYRITRI
ncbi:MAG: thiopurine S-methyltransferase [Granulosicoccaceae bacterium]